MEFDQLLKERYSVRKFSNQKVEKEKIGAVSGNTKESNIRKVTMDHDLVKTARSIGICLGD